MQRVAANRVNPGDGVSCMDDSTAGRHWLHVAWQAASATGASDLFLVSGASPCWRVAGRLVRADHLPACPPPPWTTLAGDLDGDTTSTLLAGTTPGQAEGVLAHPLLGRARWSLCRQRQGLLLVLRLLRERVPTLTEVQLDPRQAALVERRHGLLLVTGATGSGKSCTLAALVQHWREHEGGHVLTLEDPVEMRYPPGPGLISQRDVAHDCVSFAAGLRAALRQDPDVILIGELRDADSARLALAAAETGHLVLTTLHASGAVGALDRLLGLFPADERDLARGQLADTLIAVISQELLKRPDGLLHALREVLVATPAVRHLIREQRGAQIVSAMQTGQAEGMQTRAQALARLSACAHPAPE